MINVVIPIFAIILCGFLASKFNLIPTAGAKTLNSYVYYFALPAVLFFSLSTAPIEHITNLNFIFANCIIILGGFFAAVIIFSFVFKKNFPDVMLYGMASSFGNTGFLGIPLLIAAFGQEAAIPAAIATFMYDLLIVTIVIISFELQKFLKQNKESAGNAFSIVSSITKSVFINPINASLLLGIMVALVQIPLPTSIQVFTETLGAAAGPTALFALGLGLVSNENKVQSSVLKVKEVGTIMSLKLVLQPLIAILLVSFIFPLEGYWAIALVILSALPTGAVAYVFAERYNTLVRQMPVVILSSTVLSILTLSMFLLVMVK